MKKLKYYIAYCYNFLQTTIHKFWVAVYILQICWALIKRAIVHDLSKYSKHEAPIFARNIFKLKHVVYSSPEYKKCLKEVEKALRHHYKVNDHHGEFWKHSMAEMNCIEICEALSDWRAATRRHKKGSLYFSIIENQKRFKYNDFMKRGLIRAAKEMSLWYSWRKS